MEPKDFQKKLVNYITEAAEITNGKLAAGINMTPQSFSNRLQRGTLPVVQLQRFCEAHHIQLPKWANDQLGSTDLVALRKELQEMEQANKALQARLEEAEKRQDELMQMLKMSLSK